MFIRRRGGYNKTKLTKEVSTSTESDVQYSNFNEIQRAGDAATAENNYEPLQLHQLQHLFHSRNAVAPYVELIQTA